MRPASVFLRTMALSALVLGAVACRPSPAPVNVSPRAPAGPRAPAYDLHVEIDPSDHQLRVTGSVELPTPRTRFYLNEALTVDALVDDRGEAVAHERHEKRIELARPIARAQFRYHGRLVRSGDRDFKSHAWLDPDEIRLGEIALWYPVVYDGTSDVPWPPVPATGALQVAPVSGIHWATSGTTLAPGRFAFSEPSDLVLVGVPFPATVYPGKPSFHIHSLRHAAIEPTLRKTWLSHAARLGDLDVAAMHVVEFPATGTKNGLAFLSSNLIVLSSATCNYVVERTPRALRVVAHETAHRWFGGALRPVGPSTRWLAESFAEHYAWRVVREALGDAAYREAVAETEKAAGATPVKISELGWEDERVYTAGTLGVKALAEVVGEAALDDAVRQIHRGHREWSVAGLFEALAAAKIDDAVLRRFRADWGL